MPSADTARTAPLKSPRGGALDRYFDITARGSSIEREIRGGIVTFFTMAYIVVLNPLILGRAGDSTGQLLGGGTVVGANFTKIAAVTAFVAGVMTILMGVVGKFPLAIATGLGLNAFVAFGVAALPGMTWADAMGLIVIEGIIITILVLTGFRTAVFRAVPPQLKTAISVGIGLFITIVGLVDAGFVRKSQGGPLGELGVGGFLAGWPLLVFVVGFFIIAGLYARGVRGSILIGIVAATALAIAVEAVAKVGPQMEGGKMVNPTGWGLNVPAMPNSVAATPDLGLLGKFNLLGSFDKIGVVSALLLIFTLMLADFFDTMGTMVAIGSEAGLNDEEGVPPHAERILLVDSLSAVAGGAGSTSSNTAFIESASGVGEGARTGLASVVTGGLFLLAMFFSPLVTVVPYEAATPALIFVGFLMMQQVSGIDWDDIEIALPSFLTIALMPFTYSITAGIGAGFLAFTFLKLVRGKAREVHVLMWVVAVLFAIYFAIDPIKGMLTG